MNMAENCTKTIDVIFNRQNALGMNELAKTVFAPVYPVIARNAVAATGINMGVGLELGCGPAMLSIAMARETPDMEVVASDFSDVSKYIAKVNIESEHLENRIHTMTGDVHDLPLDDGEIDLIFSRGSMFFWKDLKKAFTEIYRVLSPGGATYIGGGFGNRELQKQVTNKMKELNPQWSCHGLKIADDDYIKRLKSIFDEIGCCSSRIIKDDSDFWIVLSKPD
jgi:ubiquinone/menaquinone biosynthesis C-methylase UbiE